jgi:hypothetical protein
MLWTPLRLAASGEPGNERGNPHVDINEVLAIWATSVPEELRQKWINIDEAGEAPVQDEAQAEESD